MTKEQMIEWINKASYEQLLSKWRFAEAGNPFFVGEVGDHYAKRMKELREKDNGEHVRASKSIGW